MNRRRGEPLSVPWWRIATSILLAIGFVLSIAAGRTVEAVVIALLLVPSLVLLGVWGNSARGDRR